MERFSTRHLVSIFKISASSVRSYADRFNDYLSIDGSRDGKHRSFNDDDLKVFQTVVVLRSENKSWHDITAFLESGQRYEVPAIDTNALSIATGTGGQEIFERFEELETRLEQLEESKEAQHIRDLENLRAELKDAYLTIGRLQGKHNDIT